MTAVSSVAREEATGRQEAAAGPLKITKGLLAKNSAYNFAGRLSLAAVSVVSLPYVVPRLGAERYGVFALIWILVEYFGVFEFGIGAATTKFIAEAVGRDERPRVFRIFNTSLLTVIVLGLVGFLVCLLIAPLLTDRFFNISKDVSGEAKTVFRIAAVLVPTTLVRSVLNGTLEAHQRFDLISCVRIPSDLLTALIPVFVIAAGFGLRTIVLVLVLKEAAVLAGYYGLCAGQMPERDCAIDLQSLRTLLSFGGWLCLVRSLGLLMLSLEPFFIGALVSVRAVTYYSVPYKLVGAMLMLPASIMVVLYPAFSTLSIADEAKMRRLFLVSLRYVAAILGFPVLILAVFPGETLTAWLGADFAGSAMVMRLLALGTFFAGLSWLFGTLLSGTGHAKATAILGLCQVPAYVWASWHLIGRYDIDGAAAGWAAQKLVGAVLLAVVCWKLGLVRFPAKLLGVHHLKLVKTVLAIALAFGGSLALKHLLTESLVGTVLKISIAAAAYVVIAWYCVVDAEQKAALLRRLALCRG